MVFCEQNMGLLPQWVVDEGVGVVWPYATLLRSFATIVDADDRRNYHAYIGNSASDSELEEPQF